MCWQLVTKHHMMFHIAQLTELSLLNPRVSWCYQYENMVQKIIRVAKASVNGIQLHQIGNNLLKKEYRLVLHLRLTRRHL